MCMIKRRKPKTFHYSKTQKNISICFLITWFLLFGIFLAGGIQGTFQFFRSLRNVPLFVGSTVEQVGNVVGDVEMALNSTTDLLFNKVDNVTNIATRLIEDIWDSAMDIQTELQDMTNEMRETDQLVAQILNVADTETQPLINDITAAQGDINTSNHY